MPMTAVRSLSIDTPTLVNRLPAAAWRARLRDLAVQAAPILGLPENASNLVNLAYGR